MRSAASAGRDLVRQAQMRLEPANAGPELVLLAERDSRLAQLPQLMTQEPHMLLELVEPLLQSTEPPLDRLEARIVPVEPLLDPGEPVSHQGGEQLEVRIVEGWSFVHRLYNDTV